MGRDLQKAIKDTIIKYKEINFGIDSPICLECSNEPQKQQLTMRQYIVKDLQRMQ